MRGGGGGKGEKANSIIDGEIFIVWRVLLDPMFFALEISFQIILELCL